MNRGQTALVASVAALAAAVCSTAGAQVNVPDSSKSLATVQDTGNAEVGPNTAEPTGPFGGGGAGPPGCDTCGPVTITQSLDPLTITMDNSISCNVAFSHTDNGYFRAFTLAAHGITGAFTVCSVEIGLELVQAGGGAGSQPIEIRLYDTNDVLNLGAGTQIAESITTVADQVLTIECFPLSGVAASGGLTVEIFTPNGQAPGHIFFIGSNPNGQLGLSYIAAAACGAPDPTPTGALGEPDMHIVMKVHGKCSADVNGDGSVNVLDLVQLLLCFGLPATASCDTGQDVNGDGNIDVLDLIDLLLAFGTVCT